MIFLFLQTARGAAGVLLPVLCSAQRHEDVVGNRSGGITPPFLNLGVRWGRVQTLPIDPRVRESPIRLGRSLCDTGRRSGTDGEANETSLATLESSVDSAVIEAVNETLGAATRAARSTSAGQN